MLHTPQLTLLFLYSPDVHWWVMKGIHFNSLFFCFPAFLQVTRAQYQNGLLASKLDSTPQSPQSNHIRLDSMVAPSLTPPTTSTTCTVPSALRDGPNETTTLLNDKNSLNSHRAAQPQSYSNSNSNSNLNISTNTNSSPHPLSNNHPQTQSYPNNPNTQTPHLHIHTISHSHAHTESTIWLLSYGWREALERTRLIHKHAHTHKEIYKCTWPFKIYMQSNTEALTHMNFGAGLSSYPSCMAALFPISNFQFDGISVKPRCLQQEISACCERDPTGVEKPQVH